MRPLAFLTAAAAAAIMAATPAARAAPALPPISASFYQQALCVHDGWHYRVVPRGVRSDYALGPDGHQVRFARSYFQARWGHGEGSWTGTVGSLYGGGMSFMVSTWNRAAAVSHGWVPFVSSTTQIARQLPVTQIIAAYMIVVVQDHGSWREWPTTGRACSLPM